MRGILFYIQFDSISPQETSKVGVEKELLTTNKARELPTKMAHSLAI